MSRHTTTNPTAAAFESGRAGPPHRTTHAPGASDDARTRHTRWRTLLGSFTTHLIGSSASHPMHLMAGSGSMNDDLHHRGFVLDDEDDVAQANGNGDGDGDPNTQSTLTNVPPPTGGSPMPSTASTDVGGATKRERCTWSCFCS
jgi:hypothetical protein